MRRLTLMLVFAASSASLTACGPTIGDACTTDSQCGSGVCLTRDFTPNGSCSLSCDLSNPSCPSGSACVRDAIGLNAAGCMRTCKASAECRQGYICKTSNDSPTICVGPQGI